MNSKMAMVLALIMGVVAVIGMRLYLQKQREEIQKGVQPVKVVSAARDILQGEEFKLSDFKEQWMQEGLLDDFNKKVIEWEYRDVHVGRKAAENISAGKILLEYHFEAKGHIEGLKFTPEMDKRAITIPVTEVSGLGGVLKQGDRVDVLAAYRLTAPRYEFVVTVAEALTVLGVGSVERATQLARGAGGPTKIEAYRTVTLMATPEEAQKIAHAVILGMIHLTLRDSADRKFSTLPGTDTADLVIEGIRGKKKVEFDIEKLLLEAMQK